MNILNYVPRLMDSRQSRANAKIHVREEAVLSIPGAHPDRASVAVADLDVDVRHCGVEGTRVRIGHRDGGALLIVSAPSSCTQSTTSKEEHDPFGRLFLEARRIRGQNNHRPCGAVTNKSYTKPDMEGVGDGITALLDENQPLTGRRLNLVDRLLEHGRAVA